MDLALAQSGDSIEVADGTFGAALNEALIHQVVTAYMAAGRCGTRAQKTRAEVRGGGAKPWRQKGTGRARAGSSRNPLWRGGGVTFAARPQNHAQKVNRKVYRGAMRSILSELLRRERLIVVGDFSVTEPKTRELLSKLGELALDNVIIVTAARDTRLELAARNLQRVDVCASAELDPVSLVAFDKVLMTVPALREIEERLA